MSASTQIRLLMASATALLVAGLIGWWIAPPDVAAAPPMASLTALWLSGGGLAAAVWAITSRQRSDDAIEIAALALGGTAPLSAVPWIGSDDPLVVAMAFCVAALAVLPLGLRLSARILRPERSEAVGFIVIGCIVAAAIIGWLGAALPDTTAAIDGSNVALQPSGPATYLVVRWLLVAAGLGIAAAAASASALGDPQPGVRASARIVTALAFCAAALVPVLTGIALVTDAWQWFVVPLVAAGITGVVLARVAIGPLARQAGHAVAERDLVIAASEAERNRLAAALHDGPLGDIALLIQRLDAAGAADDAAIARSIASELRTIGNDLHTPVLEDLGAGPAIEWLVQRLSRRAGTEVRLDLAAEVRPPAEVELAVYRITQEALSNAIRYGRPPLHVSYVARPGSVSLSIDDAGPGMDRQTLERAQREGRLGLVLMSQRAEAIGAELTLTAPPGGGTHVGLIWPLATA